MTLPMSNDFGVNAAAKRPRRRTGVQPPSWLDPNKVKYEFGGKEPQAHIQPITPIKPLTSVMSPLDRYLAGDSTYQQTLRGNKRTLADFLSELARRRGEAGTQFNKTQASMNRDAEDQLNDLREEFASRGTIQSGLYGKAQGNFREKFAEQIDALNQQQTGLLSDLLSQETNYRRENSLANEAARQEAILRRAEKYRTGVK